MKHLSSRSMAPSLAVVRKALAALVFPIASFATIAIHSSAQAQAITNPSSITRVSSFEYSTVTGMLTKEIIEPDSAQSCLVTTHGYDSRGNKTSVSTAACAGASGTATWSAAAARVASTIYSADGRFPERTTNALGHSETKTYDLRFGLVSSLTGPNSLTTTWLYDGFGRKTRESRADGTYSTWDYKYCTQVGASCPSSITAQGSGASNGASPILAQSPVWQVTERVFGTNNLELGPYKRQYHDALNRVIRAETLGFDGAGVPAIVQVQDTAYNALGQVARKSNTYDAAQPASAVWVAYTYDVLGRLIKEEAPDSAAGGAIAITHISYNGLSSTIINSKGQTKTTTKDALGRTAMVTDHLGGTVSYDYDALGQLIQTDAAGSITKIQYNLRGQKIRMDDPAMGVWEYAYNAFGELVYQSDSLGQSSTIAYDALGRMVQRNESDLISSWVYDNCAKGVGKLCQASSDNGYKRVHNYDDKGRPSSTATKLDSTVTTSISYETATGRVSSQTYPTGYQARYTYTALGFLQTVSGVGTGAGPGSASQTATYTVLAINAQGQITSYRYGNQVITNKTYDAQTGRLTAITATKEGLATGGIQQTTYQYDSLSNLTARGDVNTGVQETFLYDNLNRLTNYQAIGGSVTAQDASANVQVIYDARGNITYKSDVGRYWYDPQRPNRLTNITLESMPGAAPLTGTRALAYAFDDYNANARTLGAGMGAASGVVMGNGNLMYTVSQDNTTGRHSIRWETYTSFNMPKELALVSLGQAQTSTAATLTGVSCVEGVLVEGECARTAITASSISSYHCYAYPSATLVGTQCNWTTQNTTVLGSAVATCPSGFTLQVGSNPHSTGGYGTYCSGYRYGYPTTTSFYYSCPSGQVVSGTSCIAAPVYNTAPATAIYSCPFGMKLVGSGSTATCEYVQTSQPACSSGYVFDVVSASCRVNTASTTDLGRTCFAGDMSYNYAWCKRTLPSLQACNAYAVTNSLAQAGYNPNNGDCFYVRMTRCPNGTTAKASVSTDGNASSVCMGVATTPVVNPPTSSFPITSSQVVTACPIAGSSGYAVINGDCVKQQASYYEPRNCFADETPGTAYGTCKKTVPNEASCNAHAVAQRLTSTRFDTATSSCQTSAMGRCPVGSISVGTARPGYDCYIDKKPAMELAQVCQPGGYCKALLPTLERPKNSYSCPTGYILAGERCFSSNITTSQVANRTLTFTYGPEHQRISQRTQLDSTAPANMTSARGVVYYLNGENNNLSYEKEVKDNGLIEHKHYLSVGGIVFAMQINREGNLATGGTGGTAKPASTLQYLHHDHLGSVAVVTDETGSVAERLAYDPWGKRRFTNGTADTADTIVGLTLDRGFTMHEHLDEMGVIHMNGRIYDPLIGRFMSADPFIQAPENLQSHNRFAYVMNNPLAYTDPSGYFSLKKLFRAVVAIAVGYFTGQWIGNLFQGSALASGASTAFANVGYAGSASAAAGGLTSLGSAIAGAAGGFAGGLVGSGSLKGALNGAFSGGVFGAIGGMAANTEGGWSTGQYVAAHAAGGCITSVAGGGQCGSGALSAAFGKFTTIQTQDWGAGVAQFTASVVAGGVGSVIGGGKFESGATTAAYSYLFNNCLANAPGCLTAVARGIQIGYSRMQVWMGNLMYSPAGQGVMQMAAGEVGLQAPSLATNGVAVLGKFPAYLSVAHATGGEVYNIPMSVWNRLLPAERWAVNTRFLDDLIYRDATFILSTPASKATGYYADELNYLASKGYRIMENSAHPKKFEVPK